MEFPAGEANEWEWDSGLDHDPEDKTNPSREERRDAAGGDGDDGMEIETNGDAGSDVTYPTPQYPTLPRQDFRDWRYYMRRSCQEIVPDLYLGIQNIELI